jgi:hypothetical protein
VSRAAEDGKEPTPVEQESDHRAAIVAGSEPTDQPVGVLATDSRPEDTLMATGEVIGEALARQIERAS